MISFLRGRLHAKHPPQLVVDVDGVGYELDAPMSTFYGLPAVGTEVSLFTHLVVREDAHILFGFGTDRERRMFRELLKVSGIGPRLALSILSGIHVDELLMCVTAENADALVRIPGVGRKTAERLLIEMRDRVKGFGDSVHGGAGLSQFAQVAGQTSGGAQSEAFSALLALGYKPAEITRLLKAVDPGVQSVEDIIRHALKAAVQK
ncbi:MAG: Holliday junction branch migration protein RuvA [Steroidobacteraceae bacterium]